jgi:hypothetical protein
MSRTPSPDRTPRDLSGAKPFKFNNGWGKEQEELMAGWADRAACYRWMHDKCEKIMAKNNMWITVPVIILSTLTGSANFIMGSLLEGDQQGQKFAQIGIGGVSIFTGILTTLGNFFRYAQSSEAHRVAGISWGKFQRQIDVELKLHPKERIDCMDYLKICRAEFDRLIEQSPPIPDKVISHFEAEFKDNKDLIRPDIAHGMDHTKIFVDKDTRLKQIAADAAIFLMQKRKVWHNAMMPDVENHVDKKVKGVVADLSGNNIARLHEKIAELERKIDDPQRGRSLHSGKGITGQPSLRSFLRDPSGKKPERRASSLTRPVKSNVSDPHSSPQKSLRELHLQSTVPSAPVTSAQLISALSVPRQVSSDHVELELHVPDEKE